MDLNTYLDKKRSVVNKALGNFLDTYTVSQRLLEPMAYCINAGGKRLRPILCIAAYEAVTNVDSDIVLPVACALEMIHTYSLIHDDLPALDDDKIRRGTPTCHIRYNEATAVLAGDGLLNTAFELLADWAAAAGAGKNESNLPVVARLKVIQAIARAAGCRGMIEGQARDLAFEGRKISLADLEKLHKLKTGAMIEAAVLSGALVARAGRNQLSCLQHYSVNLGLAFQVIDDILNVVGDPKILGKAVGTDSFRQKNTYPALLGLDGARNMASDLVASALDCLAEFDSKADPLRAIAGYVLDRNR